MNKKSTIIKKINYESIVKLPYCKEAVIRDDFPGFKEDYIAIHSIIRKFKPNRIMEVGTSTGLGTNVICNAMMVQKGILGFLHGKRKVISIDVPPGTDAAIIYPDGEDGHPQKPGENCSYPYTQIFGSSIKFDFTPYYPIDAWFIDGKHDYEYCSKDTKQALKSDPYLIIWHDMQIKEVYRAVVDTMSGKSYKVFWINSTRVAYAIKV